MSNRLLVLGCIVAALVYVTMAVLLMTSPCERIETNSTMPWNRWCADEYAR